MKVQVQGYEDSIEVGQYRPIRDRKGALKATFSLMEYPKCRKTLECKYFEQGENRWFSFPTKEKKKEGQKTEYIPLVSYGDKEYDKQLRIAVLTALREHDEAGNESVAKDESFNLF